LELINSIDPAMTQQPQSDIRSFFLGQVDAPEHALVFRGAQVIIICSNCEKPFSKQGRINKSHERACGIKPKAVSGGRVKIGPLYSAGEARLAAEAEEKRISTENAKRFKAWEEDDSA
jgi:hypothetical protein